MNNLNNVLAALASLSNEERAALVKMMEKTSEIITAPTPTVRLAENERVDPVTGEIKRRPGRPRKNPAPAPAPAPMPVESAPVEIPDVGPMVPVKGWDHKRFREHGATFDHAAKVWLVPAEHAAKLASLEAEDEAARAARRAALAAIGGRWDRKDFAYKVPSRHLAEARKILGDKARIVAI